MISSSGLGTNGGIGGLGGGGGYNGSLDGENNTGGGGAGGIKENRYPAKNSGNGGSGVVIIKYNVNNANNIILGSYKNILTIDSSYVNNLILKNTGSTLTINDILNRQNSLPSIPENNKTIKNVNTSKFKEIIEEILSQSPENILGYLLYKKLYYNIILFNISIQNAIRVNYLNDDENIILSENTIANLVINSCDKRIQSCRNLNNVKDYINDNKKNIEDLIKINLITSDYLIEKNKYVNKINELNNLNIEFNKSIDTLNIYIKLYNEQYNKYNLYKKNATYIIIPSSKKL